jgi:DNA-3-methyladenine glycosylase
MNTLPPSFYMQSTLQIARDLLGKHIIRLLGGKFLMGTIVETEAYLHNDPAPHSFRGQTQRNKVMFFEGGHLYVYFTYGMHFCANVVTGKKNIGEAVLIRAVEPIAGIEVMMKNRFPRLSSINHQAMINLTNGPAKFCRAFGIARQENGLNLFDSEIRITEGESVPAKLIKCSARIGIQHGVEKKWRFFVAGNRWVSR